MPPSTKGFFGSPHCSEMETPMSVTYPQFPFSATPRRRYRPTGLGTRPNVPGWPDAVRMLRVAVAAAKARAPQAGGPTAEHLACVVIDRVEELGVRERHLLAVL